MSEQQENHLSMPRDVIRAADTYQNQPSTRELLQKIIQLAEKLNVVGILKYPPLQEENRVLVPTACAAYHLDRKEQTLRAWASKDSGPISPLRIKGRLYWRVEELKRLLEVK